MKRPGSSFHQLVQRILADVAAKVRGLKLAIPGGDDVANVVISERAKDVRTSLRMRDPVAWIGVQRGPAGHAGLST